MFKNCAIELMIYIILWKKISLIKPTIILKENLIVDNVYTYIDIRKCVM